MSFQPFFRLLLSMATVFVLAGCINQVRYEGKAGALTTLEEAGVDSARPVLTESGSAVIEDYRLQVSDTLSIRFFYSQELNQDLIVRPDGRISLQLIGEVQAAGLTTEELRGTLQDKYTGILRKPQVSVIVTQFSTPKAYVNGEIRTPGEIELTPNLTVLQAVARSGGFTDDAELENVVVLRYRKNAAPRFYGLNIEAFLDQGLERYPPAFPELCDKDGDKLESTAECSRFYRNIPADLRLQPFDIVYVPKTRIASVADFFNRYVNNIIPLYRNIGLSFTYELSDTQNP